MTTRFSLEEAARLAQVASAAVALVALVISLVVVWLASRTFTVNRATHDVTSLFHFLVREYLDHTFHIPAPPMVAGKPVAIGRSLKTHAQRERSGNPTAWQTAVKDFAGRPWENRLAYQLSILLERLGIATISGALPLRVVLSLCADQIMDDWTLCDDWIRSYRGTQTTYHARSGEPFHRRYGEWLALLSALWMRRHYPNYEALRQIVGLYGGERKLRSRFIHLMAHESHIFGPGVKRDVRSVLGLYMWFRCWQAWLRAALRLP